MNLILDEMRLDSAVKQIRDYVLHSRPLLFGARYWLST